VDVADDAEPLDAKRLADARLALPRLAHELRPALGRDEP
jgi:hypothetical protein